MSPKEGTERWGSGLNLWATAIAITMSGLEFVILLPQSSECCDYNNATRMCTPELILFIVTLVYFIEFCC